MNILISYSVRVILVYFFTYLSTRILTKKAIAEMTAYEMAGLMVFANVAAEPLVDKVVIKSVFGSGLIILLMLITARLALKNSMTPIMEHTATILIHNGNIDFQRLKTLSLSVNQLLGLLRQQGFARVSDVGAAIFEPQGKLSVFPKPQSGPEGKGEDSVSFPFIIDGKILQDNLRYSGKNEVWLMEKLKEQGVEDYRKQVILAELDSQGNVAVFGKWV